MTHEPATYVALTGILSVVVLMLTGLIVFTYLSEKNDIKIATGKKIKPEKKVNCKESTETLELPGQITQQLLQLSLMPAVKRRGCAEIARVVASVLGTGAATLAISQGAIGFIVFSIILVVCLILSIFMGTKVST